MSRPATLAAFLVAAGACTAPQPAPTAAPQDAATPSDSAAADGGPAATTPFEASGAAADYPEGSLPALLASDGRFRAFLTLMERDAYLLQRLLEGRTFGYTLFVPTDEAILRLAPDVVDQLANDPVLVTGVVERHFLSRTLPSDEFATSFLITGMSRRLSRIALVLNDEAIWFGVGRVIETDVHVSGGIVHVIDAVNLGPTPDRYPIP